MAAEDTLGTQGESAEVLDQGDDSDDMPELEQDDDSDGIPELLEVEPRESRRLRELEELEEATRQRSPESSELREREELEGATRQSNEVEAEFLAAETTQIEQAIRNSWHGISVDEMEEIRAAEQYMDREPAFQIIQVQDPGLGWGSLASRFAMAASAKLTDGNIVYAN